MGVTEMDDQEQLLLLKLEESTASNEDEGGITIVLVFSVFVAVSGSFLMGSTMGYSSPVQSAIVSELGLSTADYSLFGSTVSFGALLGSTVCGKLTDYIGRRRAMGLADVMFLFGWLSITLTQGSWLLDLGRLVQGFAVGLVSYAVPVYVAEITPKSIRGGAVLLHQLMSSFGLAFVYIVGLVTNWRMLSLFCTVPCIAQLLFLFFIPESPRWLVRNHCESSYEAALQSLRGHKTDISQEATEIKDSIEASQNTYENNLQSVFQKKYAFALVVTIGLMALSYLSGASGFVFYASAIFESAGVSNTVGSVSIALIQLPLTICGVFLMDKFGRRSLLLFSASGMSFGCFSVAMSYLMKEHGWMKDTSPYLALLGTLIAAATFSVGLGGIPPIIMSEMFPMNVKGAAGSLATVVGSTSGWIVAYAFNFMMEWSSSGTFFIFTSINVGTLLFVAKLVPETKGRTLEELQKSLTCSVEHL